jgi:hypothetical protein
MNRYIFIRRLRGPAILLLIGGVELLHQLGVLRHSWGWIWPLGLILIGALWLAERAALHDEDGYPQGPYPYQASYPPPYAGAPYGAGFSGAGPGAAAPQQPGTAIVPAKTNDFGSGSNGGQL